MSAPLSDTAGYLRQHRIICLSRGAIEQADELEQHAIAVESACAALRAADDDIRELLQVARYNLTGMMHTGDQCPIPNPPRLIHAEGIAKSERVREQIRATLNPSPNDAGTPETKAT